MIRYIIIVGALICVPVIVYMAVFHGQPPSVTFIEAVEKTQHTSESDPAAKVLVEAEVVSVDSPSDISAKDMSGTMFRIEYTGTTPSAPFTPGTKLRLVGHVHGGTPPLFHATQAFTK